MGAGESAIIPTDVKPEDIAAVSQSELQSALAGVRSAEQAGGSEAEMAHAEETAEEVDYLRASENLDHWNPVDKFMTGPPWKFVWFSAADDFPASELVAPVWKQASAIWHQLKGTDPDVRVHVDWLHKDCYGPGWTIGPDFEECPNAPVKVKNNADHLAGLRHFPTLRLYGPMGQTDFNGQRTTQNLVNFVRKYVDPPEAHATRNPKSVIDNPPVSGDVEASQDAPAPPPPAEETELEAESGMGSAVGTLGAVVVDASRQELQERRLLSSRLVHSSMRLGSNSPQLARHLRGDPGSQVPGRPAGLQPSASARSLGNQRRQPRPSGASSSLRTSSDSRQSSSRARGAAMWSFL